MLPDVKMRLLGAAAGMGGESRGKSPFTPYFPPHSLNAVFTLFYSNITTWGGTQETTKENRVEPFVAKERADVIAFVEHHLDRCQFAPVRPKLKMMKRAAYISYARRLGLHRAATSGGQIIMPRASLDTSDLDPALVDHCLPRDHAESPRWTAMVLRTRGVSVLIVAVYLRTGEGLSEENRAIIDQLLLLAAFFVGIVVIVGDWQMTVEQLSQISLISKVGLAIVAPPLVDATCSSGEGRLIDFCLLSERLVPYSIVEPEHKVPWKPHIGFRLSFPARLRSLMAPSLRVPRPLPPVSVVNGEHQFDSQCWTEAGTLSAEFISKRGGGTGILCCDSELLQLIPEPQRTLTKDLCKSATHLEFYHVLLAKVEPSKRPRFIGRGGLPHASLKPVFNRNFLPSRYSCPSCDLWDMVITLMGWILRFSVSQTAPHNTERVILDLKLLEPRVATSWFRAAAPNAPPAAWSKFLEDLSICSLSTPAAGFDSDRIKIWISRAEAQKKVALSSHKKRIRGQFRRWLRDDLKSGGAAAHKLVSDKAETTVPEYRVMQSSFTYWSQLWMADEQPAGNLVKCPGLISDWIPWKQQLKKFLVSASSQGEQQGALNQVRQAAIVSQQGTSVDRFTPEAFRDAARSYPVKKGMGVDFWTTDVFRPLPLPCVEPLSNVLSDAFAVLQWPVQMLLNLMALIPKAAGGERSIAKTPLLYRLFNIWRTPELREWGDANVSDFDYATRGNSALSSGALRAWSNEVASISGQDSLSILWDIWKFFDSIAPSDVLRAAVDAAYPPSELVLALSMHVAPRCMILNGVASCIIYPNRSIIAGCSHSNYFARMPIKVPIERMALEAPAPILKVATFVDDVSQTSRGSIAQIASAAVKAAISFCTSMRHIGLQISSKTVVVSSQPRLARALAAQIRKHQGISVVVANTGRDLGVVNNPTRRRSTILQDSRIGKAKRKLRRVARYTKAVRSARRLTTTGAMPQALWGLGAVGLAPTTIKSLRTDMAISTGISATGRCPITAIAICFGERADPEVAAATEQIALWMQLWRSEASLRAMSVRHWSSMASRVTRSTEPGLGLQTSWNSVTGPFGATLCTLTDQGWDVTSPLEWRDPEGRGWIPDTTVHPKPFVELVQKFAISRLWDQAQKHWCGKGLAGGVDLKASIALHKHISKVKGLDSMDSLDESPSELVGLLDDQEQWPTHALTWLEILLTGGYWPAERASEVHSIRSHCERCGAPVESPLHLLWTCSKNARILDERVRSTQCYIPQAVEGARDYACFWLRGLVPADLVKINTPFVAEEILECIGAAPLTGEWPPGTYYTDASGGPHSQVQQLRRCGVGIAVIDEDSAFFEDPPSAACQTVTGDGLSPLLWGVHSPLPGQVHTVPRAELFAILLVAKNVMQGVVVVVTDSKVNADMFGNGKSRCLEAANSDLWAELWSCIEHKALAFTIRWVRGHGDDAVIFQKFALNAVDVIGNLIADKLADHAAELYKVWQHDAFSVQWHHSLAQKIQARAVCIFSEVLEPRTRAVVSNASLPKERPLARSAAAFRSQHRFTTISGRVLTCRACLKNSPSSAAGIRQWLTTPCTPDRQMHNAMHFASSRPTAVPRDRVVAIGRQQIHESHTLSAFRGLYFCTLCGYTASVKAQELAKECSRKSSRAAHSRVQALKQGKRPSGLKRWPNDPLLPNCL